MCQDRIGSPTSFVQDHAGIAHSWFRSLDDGREIAGCRDENVSPFSERTATYLENFHETNQLAEETFDPAVF